MSLKRINPKYVIKIHWILFIIFFLYATIFEQFNFSQRNILIVYVVPLLLYIVVTISIVDFKWELNIKFSSLILFAIFYLFSAIINIEATRISSIAYTLNFIICFFIYLHLIAKYINVFIFRKWLIWVISLFFISLIIQQTEVLLYHDLNFNRLSTTKYDIPKNFVFSLNSLSTEPSYAATIISICFLSLLKLNRSQRTHGFTFRKVILEGVIWLMYLYQIVFYRSVIGMILFGIILLSLINFKKIQSWILIILILSFLVIVNVDYPALSRLVKIFQKIDLHNISNLWQIDHSGSIRILPLYHYIVNFDFDNYHSYLGFGLDYTQNFIRTKIPGIPVGVAFGGLIPSLLFDFGIISFILLWIMILKISISKFLSMETVILIFVMLNATLNTQLFWFVLIVLAITRNIQINNSQKQLVVELKGNLKI